MSNSRFSFDQIPSLQGKVALVTGGNGGIGLETIRYLALNGAKVYMGARNQDKARAAIDLLRTTSNDKVANAVTFLSIDLADLASVRRCAKEFASKEEKLDILVCNAGVMASPYELTKDNIEMQFQTNHLGHFLLVQLLLPLLQAAGKSSTSPARVVNLTSIGHHFLSFNPIVAPKFDSKESINRPLGFLNFIGTYMRYSQAKLSALLFAREFNKRVGPEVRATAVHPGIVGTDLYRYTIASSVAKHVMITPAEGALASLYAATSTDIEKTNTWDTYRGTYGVPAWCSSYSKDAELQKSLWDLSEALVR